MADKKVYSQRNKPASDKLKYEIPINVRSRIIHTLDGLGGVVSILQDVAPRCRRLYGALKAEHKSPSYSAWGDISQAEMAQEHFYKCSDRMALDFIEMMFQSERYTKQQTGVDAVNDIFKDEDIGFELTPYDVKITHQSPTSFSYVKTFPEVIKNTDKKMQQAVIMPALQLLSGPKWASANKEMLDAHRHLRNGDLAAANTACGAAFESVFKIICTEKNWTYAPTATLKDLAEICKSNNLFESFYVEIFKAAGTVRNKLGAHGQGPTPPYQNNPLLVEHLIQTTSAHILLLAKLAGMA